MRDRPATGNRLRGERNLLGQKAVRYHKLLFFFFELLYVSCAGGFDVFGVDAILCTAYAHDRPLCFVCCLLFFSSFAMNIYSLSFIYPLTG